MCIRDRHRTLLAVFYLSACKTDRLCWLQESGVVNVQGKEFYRELVWNQKNLEDYSTEIAGMNMSDNAHAEIRWKWDGKMGFFGQVSGEVQSTLYLNVLTGRVEEHTDNVTLSGNPLAQLSYKLSKLAWASKLKAKQVGNTVRTRFKVHVGDVSCDMLLYVRLNSIVLAVCTLQYLT